MYTVLSVLVYTRAFFSHLISRYTTKNIYEILNQTYRCNSDMSLYKWKVIWKYTYSPFKKNKEVLIHQYATNRFWDGLQGLKYKNK